MSVTFFSIKVGILENRSGQGLVEFALMFLVFLVVAWIPADFGLAFYTSQLAQNASREGARIAAADRTIVSGTTSCVMPSCTGNIFSETAARISSALLTGTTITLSLDPDVGPANCNRMVTVTVSGSYNYFFYRLLAWFGVSVNPNTTITRTTSMRWEPQFGC